MAFTQKEVQFLEDNRNLIEQGKSALSEIAEKVLEIPRYDDDISRSKLIFAIVYSIEGVNGFTAAVSSEYKSSRVEGALLNRTAAKANGVALLPAMFKSKTKVVYYKIENNKIANEVKSRLVDMATYKDELNKGGYNLVIVDTPENVKSVQEAFGGIIQFTIRLMANVVADRGILKTVSVESTDPAAAKDLAKAKLIEELTRQCDGMTQPISAVVNSVISKTDFKS
jgi:mannose/fructose/N-acetylgalactosamine-specific phosphotransferase system component IIB